MLCSAFLFSIQDNFWTKSYETKNSARHKRDYKKTNDTNQQNQELNTLTYGAGIAGAKTTDVAGVGSQTVKTDSMKKREQEAKIKREKQAEVDRINKLKKQREDAVHQNHITGFMNISKNIDKFMKTAHSDDESYSTKFTGSAQLDGASGTMKDTLRAAFEEAVKNITSYANAQAVMKAAGGSDEGGVHSEKILKQKSSSSGKTIEEHLSNLEDIEDSMKNYELSEEDLKSLKIQHEQEIASIKEAATSYWKENGGEGKFWNIANDDVYFDHATFAEELENHMNENPSATEHFSLHEENMTQHILASRQNAKSTSNKTE